MKEKCSQTPEPLASIQGRENRQFMEQAGSELGVDIRILADGRKDRSAPGTNLKLKPDQLFVEVIPTEHYISAHGGEGMDVYWRRVRELQNLHER